VEILFTNTINVPKEYEPKPASVFIPDWYKNMSSYLGHKKVPDENNHTHSSLKRCMPVFDSMVSGYIITSYTDVYISQRDVVKHEPGKEDVIEGSIPWYQWPSFNSIEFHPRTQAPGYVNQHAMPEHANYPKWINSWAVKTPKGYSCLFLPPMHRESEFSILPGIVDTDSYFAPVNFPFYLHDWGYEGTIPAGTPLAQVIPFKRDNWQMKITNEKDNTFKETFKIINGLKTVFFDSYKNRYRQEKIYK
jgi:hypothetical protein